MLDRTAVDLGLEEHRDHVGAGLALLGRGELGEVPVELPDGPPRREHVAARVGLHDGTAPGPEGGAVLLGDTEVVGHDERRQRGGDLGDEVGLAHLGHALDARPGEGAYRALTLGHRPRGEHGIDQPAVEGVAGPVHHDQGGHEPQLRDLVLLEGEAVGGGEGLGVTRGGHDVREARQDPEPPLAPRSGPGPRRGGARRSGTGRATARGRAGRRRGSSVVMSTWPASVRSATGGAAWYREGSRAPLRDAERRPGSPRRRRGAGPDGRSTHWRRRRRTSYPTTRHGRGARSASATAPSRS